MRRIPLRNRDGKVWKYALVDNRDYARVMAMGKWYALKIKGDFYAARNGRMVKGKMAPFILMHRFIMDCPKGLVVDHRYGNTLDNRQSRLKVCTYSENNLNRHRLNQRNTSGFNGVQREKRSKKWTASLQKKGKLIWLGTYDSKFKAAKAVKKYLRTLHSAQ